MLPLILLVFAFVFAIVAAAGVSHPRVNFGWLALAFYFGMLLVGRSQMSEAVQIKLLEQLPAIITAVLAGVGLMMGAYYGWKLKKGQEEMSIKVDGRLEQLLRTTAASELAKGKLEGNTTGRVDQLAEQAQAAKVPPPQMPG